MPDTLDPSPVIKHHCFDDIRAVVCSDSDQTILTEGPMQPVPLSNPRLCSLPSDRRENTQATAFQFKLIVDKVDC